MSLPFDSSIPICDGDCVVCDLDCNECLEAINRRFDAEIKAEREAKDISVGERKFVVYYDATYEGGETIEIVTIQQLFGVGYTNNEIARLTLLNKAECVQLFSEVDKDKTHIIMRVH